MAARGMFDTPAPSSETDFPENCSVYIVPCANPDGLYDGTSNVSFGRLNAEGLDINRDFPEGWVRRTAAGNGLVVLVEDALDDLETV